MIYKDPNKFLYDSTIEGDWSLLGLDIGKNKIGVAYSNSLVNVVLPITILSERNQPMQINAICKTIIDKKITGVVIGLPVEMNGNHGTQVKAILDFTNRLTRKTVVPIYLHDERMTTALANRLLMNNNLSRKQRNNADDELSAAIILESFLTYSTSIKGI